MTTRTGILVENHWEDADLILMARLKGANGLDINQVSITSIAVKVFDLSSGDQVGTTLAPAVADTVFDTLQTDERWTADDVGYNFRYTVPGAYFPTGDRDYRVEVLFTPTSGSQFPFVAEISVQNLMGS